MKALLLKDLRAARPIVWLMAALAVAMLVYTCATGFPDEQKFTPKESPPSDLALLTTFFAVLTGASLLYRESEDGTLAFLDGLPISRRAMFWSKYLAGVLVVSVAPISQLLPIAALGALSHTSIDPPFPWKYLGLLALTSVFTGCYVLAVVLALSVFRRWFALVLGLVFLLFLWLEARHQTGIELYVPGRFRPEVVGGAIHLPWRTCAVQAAVLVGALAVAAYSFRFVGARSRDLLDRSGLARWTAAIAWRVGAPAVWIGALIFFARTQPAPDDRRGGVAELASDGVFARQETNHYQLLFRESQRAAMKKVMPEFDPAYEMVARFLSARPDPQKFTVDLASPLPAHAAGLTVWDKLRIPLGGNHELSFREILGHETAHAVMRRVGGHGWGAADNADHFFNEGMASLVQFKHFATAEEVQAARRGVAGTVSRGEVPFSLLSDRRALAKERDDGIIYPLGYFFCQALLEVYGADGPGTVVAQFQKHPKNPRASGESIWREIFLSAGYNFDQVLSRYVADLQQVQQEEAETIAQWPRLEAAVSRAKTPEGEIVVVPKFSGTAPGKVVLCTRREVILAENSDYHEAAPDGSFHIARDRIPGTVLEYMLGWRIKGQPWVIFEPWREAAVP